MSILTTEEFRALAGEQQGFCVSVYLTSQPVGTAGTEVMNHPIELRNLVTEAEGKLQAEGLRPPEIRTLLKPLEDLIRDNRFWQHQDLGLALFRSNEVLQTYSLPFYVENLAVVGRRFHIKPLLQTLGGDDWFYILALSKGRVRVLRASRDHVYEMASDQLPKSLADSLRYDEFEPERTAHTATSTPGDRSSASLITSGQGSIKDVDKLNIMRYFRQIDKGLHELCDCTQTPIVLAGVEYLLPIYREANTYQHLMEEGIVGNPDDLPPEQLHQQAWKIVEPMFTRDRAAAIDRYGILSGDRPERVSRDIETIVSAAYFGRVDTLFVALGEERWGTFCADANQVVIHDTFQRGDEDLLDFASLHTFVNSGRVYTFPLQEVPGDSPIAAILRY